MNKGNTRDTTNQHGQHQSYFNSIEQGQHRLLSKSHTRDINIGDMNRTRATPEISAETEATAKLWTMNKEQEQQERYEYRTGTTPDI
jgi:hypothetical protein